VEVDVRTSKEEGGNKFATAGYVGVSHRDRSNVSRDIDVLRPLGGFGEQSRAPEAKAREVAELQGPLFWQTQLSPARD
jgi:hypothetical protein